MSALTVLASNPLCAHVAGATVGGTATDTSGAAVPNANVSIKNTATGGARDISADSSGYYSAGNLLPGTTPEGNIHVFHEDSPNKLTEVETVKTEFGARTLGFDPKTHSLF